MVDKSKKYDSLSLLKSGIGVGAITISGYLLSFSYEKGYTSYFKIPLELIKLDLVNIFSAILSLIGLIYFITWFLNSIYLIFSASSNIVQKAFLRTTPYMLYFLIFLAITINTKTWHSYK